MSPVQPLVASTNDAKSTLNNLLFLEVYRDRPISPYGGTSTEEVKVADERPNFEYDFLIHDLNDSLSIWMANLTGLLTASSWLPEAATAVANRPTQTGIAWRPVPIQDTAARQRFNERLTGALRSEPVEDGYSHPAEIIIKEALATYPLAAPTWVQSLYLDNITFAPAISIGVVRCIGRLPRVLVDPWGILLAVGALAHQEIELREAAVRAFELWGGPRAIEILKSRISAEAVPWMVDYIEQVITDLSS